MAGKKKFTAQIDVRLYQELASVAKENGQTIRDLLEQALKFYLDNVLHSRRYIRVEVMDAFEQSVSRNRDLLRRLAR